MQSSVVENAELAPAGTGSAELEASRRLVTDQARATGGGKLALVIGLSLLLSSIPGLRIPIGGLQAHAYVLVLLLASVVAIGRHPDKPNVTLYGWGALFTIGMVATNLRADEITEALSISVKWLTIALTFFVLTRLPRNYRDLELAITGLVIGVTLIGVRGLVMFQQDPTYYMEPMRGIGSRNVFSNWTIAPMFLCAWFMASRYLRLRYKLLAFAAIVAMVVPQALSLSRSGWTLIAATFAFTLLARRSIRALGGGLLVVAVIYAAVSQFEFHDKAESRFEELRTGTPSDQLRISILEAGFEIFSENPVAGVSQAELPYEIARVIQGDPINSHNFYVELFGGTGLIGAVTLIGCVIAMINAWRRSTRRDSPAAEVGSCLLVLMTLGAIRGLTTDELLYNPSFVMGVAIAFTACRMAAMSARNADQRSRRSELPMARSSSA